MFYSHCANDDEGARLQTIVAFSTLALGLRRRTRAIFSGRVNGVMAGVRLPIPTVDALMIIS